MNDNTQQKTAYQSAPLWRRLGAIIYDTILVLAIWMLVGFVILFVFGINEAQRLEGETVVLDPLYRFILFSAMLSSALTFFTWFWTNSGQTLGMQAWKIKIQNKNGSNISIRQALIRFTLAPLSFGLFGAGYFLMFFNQQQQTLHDKVSKSDVVQVKP